MARRFEDDEIYDKLRIVACSTHRRILLLSLYHNGARSVRDLRAELEMQSAMIYRTASELEKHRFVQKDAHRRYALTVVGRSAIRKLVDCHDTAEVMAKHEAFWLEHDLSGIPDHLFDRIGALNDSRMITQTATDVFIAYRTIVGLLEESTTLELVTSVYVPESRILFDLVASGQKRVKVALTEDVLRCLIDEIGYGLLKRSLSEDRSLYVLGHDPKIALAVGDDVMAMSLYRTGGGFDYTRALTSTSAEALAWGHDLAHHYISSSERVTFDEAP